MGITYNPTEAGYILPDGTMLDFSGRHYASGYKNHKPISGQPDYLSGQRNVDYREIRELYGKGVSGTEAMIRFENEENAIRFGLYRRESINLSLTTSQKITFEQWKKIANIQRRYGVIIYYDIYNSIGNIILKSGETFSIQDVKRVFYKLTKPISKRKGQILY